MADYVRQQNKLQIQADQFPVLCSSCLGPNKNIKMFRSTLGAECKMCHRVFTLYKWRRGGSTLLQTTICSICSQLKNLCQCCLLDLELKVPSYVRDSFGSREGYEKKQVKSEQMALYYTELAEKMIEKGKNKSLIEHHQASTLESIEKIAKNNPFDIRTHLDSKSVGELRPPVDQSVKTLFVGNIKTSGINRMEVDDIRNHFAPYGLLKRIKIVAKQNCALVTFVNRHDAEVCAKALYNRLEVKDRKLKVLWAKPKKKKKRSKKKRLLKGSSLSSFNNENLPKELELNLIDPKIMRSVDVGNQNGGRKMDLPKGLDFILPPPLFNNIPLPPCEDDSFVYSSTLKFE